MSDDIVNTLRNQKYITGQDCIDAADEIERLRNASNVAAVKPLVWTRRPHLREVISGSEAWDATLDGVYLFSVYSPKLKEIRETERRDKILSSITLKSEAAIRDDERAKVLAEISSLVEGDINAYEEENASYDPETGFYEGCEEHAGERREWLEEVELNIHTPASRAIAGGDA